MTSNLLRRPILIGGLGLTVGAWVLHGFDPSIVHLGSTAIWSAIAVGSGLWWLKQQPGQASKAVQMPLQPIDRSRVEQAFSRVEAQIEQLKKELGMAAVEQPVAEPVLVEQLRQRLADLKTQTNRQEMRLAVLGSRSVGKTTLMQRLSGLSMEQTSLVGEGTLPREGTLSETNASLSTEITNADLVLFVTTGDLTDTEFQTIQQLVQTHHSLLLVFNKQDQYLPADRPVILQQLRERVQDFVIAENVVAITAQPSPMKVRQQQADGSMQERIDYPEPDLAALQERLQQVVASETEALSLATVYRQAQALKLTVQTELNQVRRTRALPVIEQYQWIAAAAAFANPVPSLDLLATATINAQMMVDLGAIYQQSFSLEQAKTVMGNLGSQMVKLGLVEMASQAISPLLKSHALTYVAGGTVQGISAAYLTRLAGLSLVEYFEEQSQSTETVSPFQLDRLILKLKAVFQDNQRTAFLQTLVKQGISRLAPQAAPSA
ncbi:MAG: DUF697 domain-containing protein [Cyanobacteria bacterium RM1_2_2]|nr:DUF697 domain-containing protein [Cyanobacteria bacterium RM1_2_2]